MISANSVSHMERALAKARPIALHRSALTEDEYHYYMAALSDLSSQGPNGAPQDQMDGTDWSGDLSLESKVITLREARAWLRGRFHWLPCAIVDETLRLFPSPLTGEKTLTGAQFLAALRLTCHAQNGMKVLDKSLIFKPASIAFAISSGPVVSALNDEILPTSLVNEPHNADVSTSSICQGPVKKRNGVTEAIATVVTATPTQTPARTPKAATTTEAPLKKLVPEKRAIDVESEDDDEDDDLEPNMEKRLKKGARPPPGRQTQSKSKSTKLPEKKTCRTNAGKRQSDAAWNDTASKDKSDARSQKKPPLAASALPATKQSTITAAATAGPNLSQPTIKKPLQYAAAPIPMPRNTRIIRPPIIPQVAIKTKKPKIQEEKTQNSHSESDSTDTYSVPKPRAKVTSNPETTPQSKSKSDEEFQNSDEDPNKEKSDSSGSKSSDADSDATVKQPNATTPSRPAAAVVAHRDKKPTVRKITVSRSAKDVRRDSDEFSRPPPNKHGAYNVERITASRTSPTGAVELRVVWEGYPESEGTWEPRANLGDTAAYARWTAMWARLGKKGVRDVQVVKNRKNTLMVNGRKREHKLVQAVGTNVNKGKWVPVKEVQEMMNGIKQAILEDERLMADRA